ncbi:MAG TPA: methyltransferase, TIGR04325 family [Opitutaceae bacterium]|nr:methyltransferase, TIGR04325 family [Opitutaceae bacterium]
MAVRRWYRRMFGWRWFRGRYATWEEARRVAGGYDQAVILEKVLAAALAVRAGQAAFERDSVLFKEPDCDHRVLAGLLAVAQTNGGRLRVLDFGGSLGSLYFQLRPFLPPLAEVRWDIVEQAHFVEAGNRHFQGETPGFFENIDAAERVAPHDVILVSTVLQYLPEPHVFVAELVARGRPFLMFNNLPLHEPAPDWLTVQHVPPGIYTASYPVWFLNRRQFLAHFDRRYRVVQEYASAAVWSVDGRDYHSTGLLLRRLDHEPGGEA